MNSGFRGIVFAIILATACRAFADDMLTKKDLSEQLPTMISLASETAMFTEFISAGQSRSNFTREHANYLRDSTRDAMKKLAKKAPAPALRADYEDCREALVLLGADLARVSTGFTPDQLRQIHDRAQQIRQRLQSIAATL